MAEHPKIGVDLGLTAEEKEQLKTIARTVIRNKVEGKPVPHFEPGTDKLRETLGAFVTIQKQGMLRGCIGAIQTDRPIYKTIEEMAESAAFRDPRFIPIRKGELDELEVEISVLTPLELIDDPERIEVGKHGLLIRRGYASGLLLPQVAAERNWDKITFLEETCRKAGLPNDTWKDKDTDIYVFSADVF